MPNCSRFLGCIAQIQSTAGDVARSVVSGTPVNPAETAELIKITHVGADLCKPNESRIKSGCTSVPPSEYY